MTSCRYSTGIHSHSGCKYYDQCSLSVRGQFSLKKPLFVMFLYVAKTTLFGVIVKLQSFNSFQTMESKLFCEV